MSPTPGTASSPTNSPGYKSGHRAHARVEDRIRAAKATGLLKVPCRALLENRAWRELVLAATDLLALTKPYA